MLVASKYEEMYAPEIGDFVYITDNAYSKTKIRAMEQKMLKGLDFDISNPLCLHFLRRNSKAGSVSAFLTYSRHKSYTTCSSLQKGGCYLQVQYHPYRKCSTLSILRLALCIVKLRFDSQIL